jgi:hypothetical protein
VDANFNIGGIMEEYTAKDMIQRQALIIKKKIENIGEMIDPALFISVLNHLIIEACLELDLGKEYYLKQMSLYWDAVEKESFKELKKK